MTDQATNTTAGGSPLDGGVRPVRDVVDAFMEHQLSGTRPAMTALQDLVDAAYSAGVQIEHLAAGLAAAEEERDQLRAKLAAIDKYSVNTLRTNSKDRGDWAEDVAFMGKLARGH
jgi:hypothetical protein